MKRLDANTGEVTEIDPAEREWAGKTIDETRKEMVLTRYQARAALLNAGLLADVETLMADAATPDDIRLMWAHKERIRRLHPATLQMAQSLGWTDTQLDDLFRAGMALES